MMNVNKPLIAAIIVSVLLLSAAILTQLKSEEGVVSAKGVIKYIPLEGGFYGIVTEQGKRYMPLNLSAEFKKDGLKVKFKARIKKDVSSSQMWGEPVEILEIKELEE